MGQFNNDLGMVRVAQQNEQQDKKKKNVFNSLKKFRVAETRDKKGNVTNTSQYGDELNPKYQSPYNPANVLSTLKSNTEKKKYKVSGNPSDFVDPKKLKVNDQYKLKVNQILGR